MIHHVQTSRKAVAMTFDDGPNPIYTLKVLDIFVEYIINKTRKHIKNGSTLLFHDGFGDRSQTIEAVKILVSELRLQGYQFVTVSELLGLGDLDKSME
ncbi:hypothetical protein B1690_09945 [Geobacillus sp. 46C-IIa]|nr:hypothetical protein [Geobacillus sp. 46C-IIa]OQP06227.1 hypothetical protein B1690_09945 [Geobacillus sp. 46C-IIa]QNU29671.1 hypothetical protein IC803_07450 [Geobacillus sp. 46C-IIa]